MHSSSLVIIPFLLLQLPQNFPYTPLLPALPRRSLLNTIPFLISNPTPPIIPLSLPVTLHLKHLPTYGGLSLSVEVSGYKYQALLDTGSPFLTSPSDVSYLTRRGGRWFEPRTTREQYGNDIYELRWGKGRVLLGDALDVGELEVGSNVEGAERDQVLVGLVVKDSKRKSLMEQLGASSFELDSLPSPKLVLSRERLEPPRNSVTYPLYDLTKWGTNVHHYGIKLTGGKFGGVRFGSGRGVRGDVVVVIDTGLTGCAISRTLRDSFPNLPPDQSISSVSLTLEDGTPLEANGLKNFETVDLPWFDNGREGEPLIVAVGVDFFGDHKYKMKGITVNPGSISLALS